MDPMEITPGLRKQVAELLTLTDEQLFERLGQELYSAQKDAADISLDKGKKLQPGVTGKAYLSRSLPGLKSTLCAKWRKMDREKLTDGLELTLALILIVAEKLNLSQTYANLVAVLTVVIVKQGLDKLCA